jgi:hypothetical protein
MVNQIHLEIASSENSISGTVEKQSSYQEFKYSVANLPEFSSFAVKIVMKSVDPAYVPKFKIFVLSLRSDFRVWTISKLLVMMVS